MVPIFYYRDKMNGGLVALWIFIIVILIIAIILIGREAYQSLHTTTAGTLPQCTYNTNSLIDLSSIPVCNINGIATTYRYDRDLNMTLAPFPTYYTDVCVGFCSSYDYHNNTCNTPTLQWNQCIQKLQPRDCIHTSNPVGLLNSTLYYGYSAGNICDS